MSKFCTDIEQSKKLKELEVDLNTANFAWYSSHAKDGYSLRILTPMYPLEIIGEEHDEIPAWSLDALIGVIKPVNENTYTIIGTLDGGAIISFDEVTKVMFQEEEIIDAAFEMVCWLKEKNKI